MNIGIWAEMEIVMGQAGVVIAKQILGDVVEVSREGDGILLVKIILYREILNIICAYLPQVELDETSKC